MALIKCPECRISISNAAIVCPSCGRPIAGKAWGAKHVVGVVLALFLGLMILGMLNNKRPGENSTEAARRDYYCQATRDAIRDAESMARQFVTDGLKTPATASFVETTGSHTDGCSFYVIGSVDSQNTFGAMLRSTFMVVLTYRPEDNKWVRNSLNISP